MRRKKNLKQLAQGGFAQWDKKLPEMSQVERLEHYVAHLSTAANQLQQGKELASKYEDHVIRKAFDHLMRLSDKLSERLNHISKENE